MSVNADKLVQIVPRLISGGTTGLCFNGLLLSCADSIPAGSVMRFESAQAVGRYFGLHSPEYSFAQPYFAGPVNAVATPQTLYIARHITSSVGAWLHGGEYKGTLENLTSIIAGGLTIFIDGKEAKLTNLNLSTATSFSGVADILCNALEEAAEVQTRVIFDGQTHCFVISSLMNGVDSTIRYATSPTSIGNTDLSMVLKLDEQGGAMLSAGMDIKSLSESMNLALASTRDWVSFTTMWEPTLEEKLELSRWQAGYDTRFCYVPWDTDITALSMGGQSLGHMLRELEIPGVAPQYNSIVLAANFMGYGASLDFGARNGRATAAYRQFENQPTTVTNDEDYENALANGYNVYADFATAGTSYRFYQPGQVSGQWEWADTYLNAIALKDSLQLNILDLLKGVRSLPYNEEGYSAVRTACLDTIQKFLRFGAIRSGVKLSHTQKVQLTREIGKDVSQTLENEGWFMLIEDPGSVVRGQRGTPDCKFYYTDGGSIQRITMSATAIQ